MGRKKVENLRDIVSEYTQKNLKMENSSLPFANSPSLFSVGGFQ